MTHKKKPQCVLLPLEPTAAMIKAGETYEHFKGVYGYSCGEFWEVMVKAYLKETGAA